MLRRSTHANRISVLGCCIALLAFGGWGAQGAHAAKIVQFETSLGSFQVELYETEAPITTANFLDYVNAGDYDGTIIHRSAKAATGLEVIQGGGFFVDPNGFGDSSDIQAVISNGTIVNEYSAALPNVRGTIAMARQASLDSASNQWFFNVVDNPLPDYAVFGRVLGDGMDIVDAIAGLPLLALPPPFFTFPQPFNELPVLNNGANILAGSPNAGADLVFVNSVSLVAAVPEPSAVVGGVFMLAGLLFYVRRQRRLA